MNKLKGYALIYACAALDLIPTRENGKWFRYGDWGCRMHLAKRGFLLLEGK